jgi:aminoglycoside 3'-phosphotransferase-1
MDGMSDEARERPVPPIALPASMTPLVTDSVWARDIVGESGDAVYRLHRPGGGADLYLKHGAGDCALDLAGEMVRLRWLGDHVPVPVVRQFIAIDEEAWLLMTALPGRTAHQMLEAHPAERPAIVEALVAFLHRLHAIPIERCPFNSDHRLRLGEARWRLDAGLVDIEDFDTERHGWSAEQVWAAMTELLPFAPDPVVTHGDFSLDNVIFADGAVIGCIDVGRAGIADRYQDLAILWNCLGEFGPALQAHMFASYGLAAPDANKVRFHLMLDELF